MCVCCCNVPCPLFPCNPRPPPPLQEEYLNYMLREYRGKDDMQKNKLLPEFQATMKAIPV